MIGANGKQRSAPAVKRISVNATVFVLVMGLAYVPLAVRADGRPPESPHRIALIDMARVFKNYKKFENLREELKGDLTKSEDKFKQMAEQIRKEQSELKLIKEGSDEYAQKEKVVLNHTSQAETYRKSQQRDLIRREAQIYKTIYLEVADAVHKYASHFNYTLVLRFTSDDVETTENPEDVMRGLNRQVVYYRPSDDITNAIVSFLNRNYQPATAAQPAEGAQAPARN
jgi:Skp family chaperone for outer membrane proteins